MDETSSKTPDAIAPLGDALGSIRELAATLGRKERLYDAHGEIYCWNCNNLGATLPTLHCGRCLRDALQQRANDDVIRNTEHPETKRWRAIFRNMSEEQLLNRERAEQLQRNCEKLPSATEERKAELQRRFDERFGVRRQGQRRGWNGRGFKNGNDRHEPGEEWHP